MATLIDPQHNDLPIPHNDPLNEPKPEPEPQTDEPAPEPKPTEDAPVCRICLMGADEAPELGKLIRPCLCKGTVGHVHVQCLNRWRKASASRKAFWQCDQCGYKYQLVRTRALGLAQSKLVVGLSTVTLFTTLVFSVSIIFSLFLPSGWIDGTSSTVANLVDDSIGDSNTWGGSSWSYYYYSPTSFASSMWKVAYQTLNEIFDDALFPNPQSSGGTSYRYKAERRRGVRAAERPVPVRGSAEGARTGPFKSTVSVPRQGATAERPVRLNARHVEEDVDDSDDPSVRRPGFLMRMVRRFLLGLSIVGAFSALSFGWTVQVPLQWMRRRGGGGGRRGEGRDNTSIYALIVLAFILFGAAKAMYSTYKLTQTLTTELLRRAETAILEVGSDQPIPLEEQPSFNLTSLRASLSRMRTRAFWRELWWECVRLFRGAKDSVVGLWDALRQVFHWRDMAAIIVPLFFALFGGGVWVWQF
ncbi:hypothetical protein EXIGLDRAFT_732847 [Exidia glandulosa HHB12029]|uniref:RING-CH-type domain-containing protein n=1 Tax=Exidia glandulosa HHB12029 TaxID=1314781 RepID=A0A165PRY5_EXIGL|nr:hypothetical protein EXIGLDRAFT_732847 [Exidia glandulosa HHB12029]